MATAQSTGDLVRGVRAFHDREDRADVIRDLPRPIIVVSGTRDRAPGPEAATALARDARCGALHLVEGSGHYVSLERPRAWDELLTRVARRVLDERR
jgi:pimeloyl-ACP methyl ester carboxylesterase